MSSVDRVGEQEGMDEEFFTKRFVECVKKPHAERDVEVHIIYYVLVLASVFLNCEVVEVLECRFVIA